MRLPGLGRARRRRSDRELERRYIGVATICVVMIGAFTYFAYVKQLPFTSQFTMTGEFTSANELEPGSLVRIAGLNIGKVSSVQAQRDGHALVTMTISQPSELHADASLAILPRLIFEGNFYVLVNPGTPEAPPMRSGATVPLSRTTTPVQIDQALDVLTSPTRTSLTGTIGQLATGLGSSSPSTAHAGAGYAGLRDAVRELNAALPSVTQDAAAGQGTEAGDLDRSVDWLGDTTGQLARNPVALADIVTSYRRTFAALAAHQTALAQTVSAVDQLARNAPERLARINRALPPLIKLASALQPAVKVAPTTLPAVSSLFRQLHDLASAPELPRLLTDLEPVTTYLPTLEQRLTGLFPFVSAAADCTSRVLVPALNMTVPDGALTNGQPVWQQLLHTAASLAGVASSFDGNGTTFRAGITEGGSAVSSFLPGVGQVVATGSIQGVDPVWLGYDRDPPFRPDVRCDQQPLPDLALRRFNQAPSDIQPLLTHPNPKADELLGQLLHGPAGNSTLLHALLGELGPTRTTAPRSGSAGPSTTVPSPAPASAVHATGTITSSTPTGTGTATGPAAGSHPVVQGLGNIANGAVQGLANTAGGATQAVHRLLGGLLGGKGG